MVQTEGRRENIAGAPQMRGDQHVFKGRLGFEQTNVLECPSNAKLRNVIWGQVNVLALIHVPVLPGVLMLHFAGGMIHRNQIAVEIDGAVGGLVYAGDAVERRGLARTVGADQGDDLSLVDLHG